ncbi:MAG: 4-hydroxy-tetrahydrodipicolinate reductase [Spirochaetales bacterium]|jgi:4-hydroxy-tetrahydrodipicolinate reductase|nr:4-hydroxy-tetrahydrodipicolinate reductase [Spirochaetales bacterium]
MKVLLMGYGRMGHEVEAALLRRGHSVVARIDAAPGASGAAASPSGEQMAEADVAIEFSLAPAVRANAQMYAGAGLSAVVGTTGWKADEDAVRAAVRASGIGFLRASNFSIGAHIFFALVEEAARLVSTISDYDVLIHEIHHNQKKDSPSGTALTAAARVLKNLSRKKRVVTEKLDRQIAPEELHVSSSRVGSVPGVHTLLLDSMADSIEITHTARSRGGFALGAVLAAEWLSGSGPDGSGADGAGTKKKGFFEVEDFINAIFSKGS